MLSPNSKLSLVPSLPREPLKFEHVHPSIADQTADLAKKIQSALPNILAWEIFDNVVGEKLMAEVRRNKTILETRLRVCNASGVVEIDSPQTILAQEQIDFCNAIHQEWRNLNMLNRGLLKSSTRPNQKKE